MAIRLVGGQSGICIDGIWNSDSFTTDARPGMALKGATAFTGCVTVKPDNPFSGQTNPGTWFGVGCLMSMWGPENAGTSYTSVFAVYATGNGAITFRVYDTTESYQVREGITGPGALALGQWNRIMYRWQASPELMTIRVNGVDWPLTLGGTGAITRLSNRADNFFASLEIGANSQGDVTETVGNYAEAAIWLGYKSDADAVNYGLNHWSPDLLPSAGRWKYVDLRAITNETNEAPLGHHARVTDRWTEDEYGADTRLYPTFGITVAYQGVFDVAAPFFTVVEHPEMVDTGGEPPEVTPLEWYDDPQRLPQRGFETWELLGDPGARSGNPIIRVPEDQATIQAAMNAAVYGDDISVSVGVTHAVNGNTYLIPPAKTFDPSDPAIPRAWPKGRVPIRGTVPIAGSVPITGTVGITALAAEPAYIHIYARGYASTLPGIAMRKITRPDGTETVVYDAPDGTSCRVYNDTHAAALATVGGCGFGQGPNLGANNYSAHHWMARGLRFVNCASVIQCMALIGSGALEYGASTMEPDHFLTNQCAWDGDPTNTGPGGKWFAQLEGAFIGIINSDIDKFYQDFGANFQIHSNGGSWGPMHIENNHMPVPYGKSLMWGGGSVIQQGVQQQDGVFRRNHCYTPQTWMPSECNPVDNPRGTTGWRVRISASNLRSVEWLSGGRSAWFGYRDGLFAWAVYTGCTMWEPATGRARLVVDASEQESGSPFCTIDSDWPGGAGDFTVYFQLPAPWLRYNSGTVVGTMPTATVANGSTAVTFSAALPAQCQAGNFFYLNNLHWDGGLHPDGGSPVPSGRSATDNGYGSQVGVAYADCRRKKIIAIAGDRLSCTLENPYIVLAGEPTTFPYSVVTFDGLFRSMTWSSQGSWQGKYGMSRFLMEANVFEDLPAGGNCHVVINSLTDARFSPNNTQNWIGGQLVPYTFTCVNDIVTISPDPGSGDPPPAGRFGNFAFGADLLSEHWVGWRRTFNPRGWPHTEAAVRAPYVMVVPFDYTLNDNKFWFGARIVRRIIDTAHLELEPVGGLEMPGHFTDITTPVPYAIAIDMCPFITDRGFTYRYNVFRSHYSGHNIDWGGEGVGEITAGRWANFHDNVYLLNKGFALGMVQKGDLNSAYGTFNTLAGATDLIQTHIRYSRNSYLHAQTSPQGLPVNFTANNQSPDFPPVRGHHLEVCDNLIVLDGPGGVALIGGTGVNGAAVNPTASGSGAKGIWEPPYSVERNIVVGVKAVADMAVPAVREPFPDNAGIANTAQLGMPSYDSDTSAGLRMRIGTGEVDPLDFSQYALAAVHTTGTVSIDLDGITVRQDGGNFPTTVTAGQFFRNTSGGAVVERRIIATGGGLSPLWSGEYFFAGAQWQLRPDGTLTPGTAGTSAVITHGTALSGDQWAECELWGGEPGLILRANNPPSFGLFAYVAHFGPTTTINMVTQNANNIIASGALDFVDGDRCRFQVSGTTLTASIDGKAGTVTVADGTFQNGRVGIITRSGPSTAKADNFTAGNMSAPTTPVINEPFGGPFPSLTLDGPPHPLAGQTGLSFSIGFTGTATDGRNPGADYATVAALTRNVRRASVFVPPPPDTVAPTITITTDGGSGPGVNFGVSTATVALAGTASDDVAVTFVSWTNDRGGGGNASGTTAWSIAGIVLQSGANVITVTAHDTANTAADTITITYTPEADVVNPVCTITTNGGADFAATGTPAALAGTASDNIGVTSVTWANSAGGSGTANGLTSWAIPSIALTSGANLITVTAADAQGNTHADTITITYTPTGAEPVCTITSHVDPLTTGTSPITVSGTATDDVAVTSIIWGHYVNNWTTLIAGGTLTSGLANWTLPALSLQSGANQLHVNAYDAASNVGQALLFITYIPGSVPPVVTITTNGGANIATGLATIALAGTATDDTAVSSVTWANSLTGGTGAATMTGDGGASATWSIASIPLAAGANLITVTATDNGGTTGNDTITVTYTVDATDPVCTITSPTSDPTTTVALTPLTLGGTASDNVDVTAVTWATDRGFSGTATGTTTWSAPGITLLTGANVITVTAHDAGGNTGTDVLTVTYTPVTVAELPVVETWEVGDANATLTGEHPWVLTHGTSWTIRNGAAELDNAGGAAVVGRCDLDLNSDDYLVTATIEELIGPGVAVLGPLARMSNDGLFTGYSAIVLRPLSGVPTLSIQRFINSAQVQIGDAIPVTLHAGMTVGIWCDADRIRAQFDGVTLIDRTDAGITTGHFFGLQGLAQVNNRVRVAQIAATVGAPTPPPGFEITISVPGTVRPVVTVRPAKTV